MSTPFDQRSIIINILIY